MLDDGVLVKAVRLDDLVHLQAGDGGHFGEEGGVFGEERLHRRRGENRLSLSFRFRTGSLGAQQRVIIGREKGGHGDGLPELGQRQGSAVLVPLPGARVGWVGACGEEKDKDILVSKQQFAAFQRLTSEHQLGALQTAVNCTASRKDLPRREVIAQVVAVRVANHLPEAEHSRPSLVGQLVEAVRPVGLPSEGVIGKEGFQWGAITVAEDDLQVAENGGWCWRGSSRWRCRCGSSGGGGHSGCCCCSIFCC